MQSSTAMLRFAGLLVVVLGTTALADTADPPATPPKSEEAPTPPKAAKFPLRVVKILADSEQALLFDANRGRHVLVEAGDTVGDYTVSQIDADEVTLAGKDMPVEIVLAAPESKKAAKHAAKKDVAPVDPYADAGAPADPYGDEPVVSATPPPARAPATAAGTADETAEPIRAVNWGAPTPPTTTSAPAPTTAVAPAPTTPTSSTPGAPATAAHDTTKLSRKEVHAALADFGALAASIDATFTPTGLALAKVQTGSVFAKVGLAPGDLVTAVDGKPLRTLDDAADLYARAGALRSCSVAIVRAGKPQTLHITVQ